MIRVSLLLCLVAASNALSKPLPLLQQLSPSQSAAERACLAARAAQLAGRAGPAAVAAAMWSAGGAAAGAAGACEGGWAAAGVAALAAGDLDTGVAALAHAPAGDWVARGALGAAHELLARRLAAAGAADSAVYAQALHECARHLHVAVAGRARGIVLPHAALAPPAAYAYRSLGQCLQWSGDEAGAQAVFAAGLADASVGWLVPWSRPANVLPLARPPRPFYEARATSAPPPLAALLARYAAALPALRDDFAALWARRREPGLGWPLEAAGLHDERAWATLLLATGGEQHAAACAIARATCALLANTPLAATRAGQAKLSLLRPGTHIKPHAGPRAASLRMHCTLRTMRAGPAAATLRVGDRTRQWADGECFIFDETFEHEVTTWPQAAVAELGAGGEAAAGVDDEGGDADARVVLIVDIANLFLAREDDFRTHAVTEDAWAAHSTEFRRARAEAVAWQP